MTTKEILIQWAKSDKTLASDELRASFEAKDKVMWDNTHVGLGAIESGRMYTANTLVEECINELTSEELYKLDAALKGIAMDLPGKNIK